MYHPSPFFAQWPFIAIPLLIVPYLAIGQADRTLQYNGVDGEVRPDSGFEMHVADSTAQNVNQNQGPSCKRRRMHNSNFQNQVPTQIQAAKGRMMMMAGPSVQ